MDTETKSGSKDVNAKRSEKGRMTMKEDFNCRKREIEHILSRALKDKTDFNLENVVIVEKPREEDMEKIRKMSKEEIIARFG